jgi:hypothetical protein
MYSFLTISIESMDSLEVLTPAINTKNNNHTIQMYPDELSEQAENVQQVQNQEHPFSLSGTLSHFTLDDQQWIYQHCSHFTSIV